MPTQSTQVKLLEALQTIFGTLATSRTIQLVKVPWSPGASHPGIFLLPVAEQIAGATNRSDDYGWGVQVVITSASNRDSRATGGVSELDSLCYDRERMIRLVQGKRILTSPELWGTVEPGPVIDPSAFGLNYDVSIFTVRGKERYRR